MRSASFSLRSRRRGGRIVEHTSARKVRDGAVVTDCGTVRVVSGNQPISQAFTASPQTVAPGDPVTLQWATYGDAAPVWMRETALHGTGPVWVEGEIRTGYSGNVLIDRGCPALDGLRFDLALGKSGGEDTLFFGSAHKAGARIGYAPEALVRESVPASRMSLGWLGRRRFRMGRTHARLLVTVHRRPRWQAMPVALAKAGYCAAATLVSLPVARARNLSALRFLLHAGVVAGLFERFGQFPAHRTLSGADAE